MDKNNAVTLHISDHLIWDPQVQNDSNNFQYVIFNHMVYIRLIMINGFHGLTGSIDVCQEKGHHR